MHRIPAARRRGGVEWRDHPQIEAWLERITPLPRWTHPYELMPGQPLPERG